MSVCQLIPNNFGTFYQVREMAGETLSGLVHNGFFSPVEEMQVKWSIMYM